MKRFAVVLLFAVFSATLNCVAQALDFTEKTWDFGSIKEQGGSVSHTFIFTNPGPGPVVIERVEASCGCTTSDFSRKPVMAGKQGQITLTYDPLYRPGEFNRTATVTANNRTLRVTLTLKGTVIERVKSVEELFPVELTGTVRSNMRSALFRNVNMGSARSIAVGLANTSSKAVKVTFRVEPACPYLKIAAPASIPAGDRADATFTFDLTSMKSAWGVYSLRVWPVVNGVRAPVPINAIAYGVDDFGSDLDPSHAPRARFDSQYHDFGDVTEGRITAGFELTNTGVKPLHIRKIQPGKGLGCDLGEGDVLRPGEKRTFTIVLDTGTIARGVYNGSIMVIVDDPLRPVRELRFSAYKK